jgi:hypothetical protein
MRAFAVIASLLSLLGVSLWFAYAAWTAVEGPPMPAVGYWALGGGVAVSLLVGCGLMALLFYSSRHGYDDIHDRRRTGSRK